jgi:hypothetical protein
MRRSALLRHAPRVLSPTRGADGPRAGHMDCWLIADIGLTRRISGLAWRSGYAAFSSLTSAARLSPTRGEDGPRAWRMDCWGFGCESLSDMAWRRGFL